MITTINEFRKIDESKSDSPNPKFNSYDAKDKMRIEDILTKSDKAAKKKTGNFTAVKDDKAGIKAEEETKAQNMANAITDYNKALRRGNAAKALGKDKIAAIFYKKARLLKENVTDDNNINNQLVIHDEEHIIDTTVKAYNLAYRNMVKALKTSGIPLRLRLELGDAHDDFIRKFQKILNL